MARQKTHRHACIDCSTPIECGGEWEQNHDALTEVFCAEFEKYRDEWRCEECQADVQFEAAQEAEREAERKADEEADAQFEAAQEAEREAERKADEEADAQLARELAEAIIAHTQAEATLTVAGDSSNNTPDVTFVGEWKWFEKFDT